MIHNLYKRRFKRQWSVDPNTISNGQNRTSTGASISKTLVTIWEYIELRSSMDLDLRKESSWSRVCPLEPAAIRSRTIWTERGENTRFESPLTSLYKTCLVSMKETSVWLVWTLPYPYLLAKKMIERVSESSSSFSYQYFTMTMRE